MPRRLCCILISCLISSIGFAANQTEAADSDDRIQWPKATNKPAKVAVILFCPKGIQPPNDYQRGVNRLADYTDRFLLDGLKRWKYSAAVKTLFRRKDTGDVEVFGVFGKKKSEQYTDASFHKEAIDRVIDRYKLEPKSHIWWVLGYKGPAPLRFEGFRGGQSPKYGGWAVANYDSRVVQLKAETPIGTPLLREMALKGMVHELGHAFRLPHIGPRHKLKKGNTLMGPTHANFRRVTGRFVKDGYVSHATAAMLVAHPVFRGRELERRRVPRIQLSDGAVSTDAKSMNVAVSGRIQGNVKPVFAIVADHSKKLPGAYWVRHYVSRVDADGRFDVAVTEPVKADGEYFLWFVFSNGELTGNGRMQGTGERGATKIPYRFQNGRWVANFE